MHDRPLEPPDDPQLDTLKQFLREAEAKELAHARPSVDASVATLWNAIDRDESVGHTPAQSAVVPRAGRRGIWGRATGANTRTGGVWSRGGRWALGAGAAALGVVLMIYGWRGALPNGGPARAFTTTMGQRSTVTLVDGTRVILAPQTTLRVPAGFGRETRTVELDGQAYFAVEHASAPFVVRTGSIVTRVLGTAFDVQHYATDPAVRVVVANGKVAVSAPRRTSVTLVEGMMGRVTDSNAVVSVVDNVRSYTQWTSDHLEFQDTPVSDVLATLSRWYGLRFELADSSLANHRITVSLDYSKTRDVVVALETLLQVSATMTPDGRAITLRPRRATTAPAQERAPTTRTYSTYNRSVGR